MTSEFRSAWEEVTKIVEKTCSEYDSKNLALHKDSAMEIYERVYQSEYLPTLDKKKKNDEAIEESLAKHQEKFNDDCFLISNKDFLKTIKMARRRGIKRFMEKPGGIFVIMF